MRMPCAAAAAPGGCSASGQGRLDAGHAPAQLPLGPRAPARRGEPRAARSRLGRGRGSRSEPLTIDLDSTIVETYGLAKQGARHHAYSGVRGYHPLIAVVAGTGEVPWPACARAAPTRAARHFLRETVGRVRHARRRHRTTHAARRQRLLQPCGGRDVPRAEGPRPGYGPPAPEPAGAHRGHPRGGLDAHPVLDRGRRRRGRDDVHPVRRPEGCGPGPAHRAPGAADAGQPARHVAGQLEHQVRAVQAGQQGLPFAGIGWIDCFRNAPAVLPVRAATPAVRRRPGAPGEIAPARRRSTARPRPGRTPARARRSAGAPSMTRFSAVSTCGKNSAASGGTPSGILRQAASGTTAQS